MSQPVVTIASVAPRPTAVVAQRTTWEDFPRLWSRLLDEVYAVVRGIAELPSLPDKAPVWQNVMLYKDELPTVEVGVLVPGPVPPSGRVIASELPGGTAAMMIHRGAYEHLGLAHRAVRDFVSAQGLGLAGPRWEIYGHWREDPREQETEVYYLLS